MLGQLSGQSIYMLFFIISFALIPRCLQLLKINLWYCQSDAHRHQKIAWAATKNDDTYTPIIKALSC